MDKINLDLPKAHIIVNGDLPKPCETQKRTRQEGPLPPLLLVLVPEKLNGDIKQEEKIVRVKDF